jgi:RHS repeat-associated protein
VNLELNVYDQPTKVISSLTIGSPNTYATAYTCTDEDGNTTATVGPIGAGSFSSCSGLSPTTSVGASFYTYDADGDLVQSTTPLAVSGTQGSTTTHSFDADRMQVMSLSADGYVLWLEDSSIDLSPYESVLLDNSSNSPVSNSRAVDDVASCVDNLTSPCADTSITTYNALGQVGKQAAAGNGEAGSYAPSVSTSEQNPDGSVAGGTADVGGGTSGAIETALSTYNDDDQPSNSVDEHWNGSAWVIDSATSTAYAPDGSTCWTSQTVVGSPLCSSPPSAGGTTTTDYYDLDGNVVAQVGPGGSGTIEPGGSCNPTAALGTYSVNTSELCAFTTYSVYNEAGQLTETIQPSLSSAASAYVTTGATTTYGYDLDGSQTTEVNPVGNTVTTTYDAASQETGVSYSDSTNTISFNYNVDGTRSQMVDSTGTTKYSYNDAAQLTSVTDSNGNTVTYGYNQLGQEDCISYPGLASTCSSSGAGTNSPPTGDVTYDYDSQGRLSSVADWNGDAFTYAYDCTGDIAWMAETPNTQIPAVTQCQGSSGTVPTAPTPSSGTTYTVTMYSNSPGSSGDRLSWMSTASKTSSGSTPLLGFGSSSNSMAYDDDDDLTSVTPYVNGTAQATDIYATTGAPYDAQHRVPLSPEPSGWSTSYDYVNSLSAPFSSQGTWDQMGIDVQPAASSTYTGLEYSGNGQLCWEATAPTASSSNPCGPPTSPSAYESFAYDGSGDLTGTTAHGFGTTSSLAWNQDTDTLTCENPAGSTCTSPGSSQPDTETYSYNGDGLRMAVASWDASTSSVQNAEFTWNTNSKALLSDGSFDYIYGASANVPIAQIDIGDSVTAELLADTNSNVRGIVEVSSSAAHPYVLAAYTDYDAYGTPISGAGGTPSTGLTVEGIGGDADSATGFGFAGGYTDTSGLIYLINRYYDPSIGQFVTVDPEVSSTGTSYAYAADDPANGSDPLGNLAMSALGSGLSSVDFADNYFYEILQHKKMPTNELTVFNTVLIPAVIAREDSMYESNEEGLRPNFDAVPVSVYAIAALTLIRAVQSVQPWKSKAAALMNPNSNLITGELKPQIQTWMWFAIDDYGLSADTGGLLGGPVAVPYWGATFDNDWQLSYYLCWQRSQGIINLLKQDAWRQVKQWYVKTVFGGNDWPKAAVDEYNRYVDSEIDSGALLEGDDLLSEDSASFDIIEIIFGDD